MVNVLICVANVLIFGGLIGYLVLIIINGKKVTNLDGFNFTKDILDEYDSINIVENKSIFTIYDIRRKVIRIASKNYYGKSISDISIPLIEAGISIVDNKKNKFIKFMKKIIPNLKLLYIFPVLVVILNNISFGAIDVKIGVVLLLVFSVFMYMLIEIKNEGNLYIVDKLNKKKEMNVVNKVKIINYLSSNLLCDKIVFFGELVMIARFILRLANID